MGCSRRRGPSPLLALGQDPECLPEIAGPDVVELAGNIALPPSSHVMGMFGPSPRRAQSDE